MSQLNIKVTLFPADQLQHLPSSTEACVTGERGLAGKSAFPSTGALVFILGSTDSMFPRCQALLSGVDSQWVGGFTGFDLIQSSTHLLNSYYVPKVHRNKMLPFFKRMNINYSCSNNSNDKLHYPHPLTPPPRGALD